MKKSVNRTLRKTQVALLATFFSMIVLMATTVVPTYAQAQTVEVETATTTMVYEGITVTAKRYDILRGRQHLIQIEAEVEVEGHKITIKSDPYSMEMLYPTMIPIPPGGGSGSDSLPTYWWDGILFVKRPGSATTWVKYDHPDNYYTYYPGQINTQYYLNGNSKTHIHMPQWILEDAKATTSYPRIAGPLAGIIAALLLIPELISKLTAAIVGLFAAVLALVGFSFYWFINDIIQAERGDGWIWTWGYTEWWVLWWRVGISWYTSFGAWRDWGFYVYVPI